MRDGVTLRAAIPRDVPALDALIAASTRALGWGYYSADQTEAAIAQVFGVDSELVTDGSYFVAEITGEIAGCGGWSRRATLFGGDRYVARAAGLLDPAHDRAKIRAFFVSPSFARRGVARALLAHCEAEARDAGFTALELMATLPGVPFYAALGFVAEGRTAVVLGGLSVPFVPMGKIMCGANTTTAGQLVQSSCDGNITVA